MNTKSTHEFVSSGLGLFNPVTPLHRMVRRELLVRLLKYGWPLFVLMVMLRADLVTQNSIKTSHNSTGDVLFDTLKPFGRAGVSFAIAIALWGGGLLAKNVKWQRAGKLIVVSIALSSVIVAIAKPVFGRMEFRFHPDEVSQEVAHPNWLQKEENRWGRFPSGDTTMAFATASSLSMEFPSGAIGFFALALLVGIGRVYVGAHLLSDAFAGAWLGWAVSRAIAARQVPHRKHRFKTPGPFS